MQNTLWHKSVSMCHRRLPIASVIERQLCRTLGALAEKCHAFAKALHYKELEYASSADTAVEALISINNQLRQPEAAIGILTLAQTQLHMELKVLSQHLYHCGTRGGRWM